jgi:integrase/recombinase XerD
MKTTHLKYSVKVVPRKELLKADNTAPLYLQSFIDGKRIVIFLNISVPVDCFCAKNQIVLANKTKGISKQQAYDYNLLINQARGKANNIFTEFRLSGRSMTADLFRNEFTNPSAKYCLIEFIEKQIKEEEIKEAGTISTYKQALLKLKLFKDKIPFSDLNENLIENFHKWMKIKERLSDNTCFKHHARVNYFINQAIKKGIKIQNPYGRDGFSIKRIKGNREYLINSEIKALVELFYNDKLPAYLKESLGKYLFSCFCGGLRISDIHNVGPEDIREGFLSFIPKKTKNLLKIIDIPINDTALQFVQYRKGIKFFDKAPDQLINRHLKEIAALAKVKKTLTFHTARHTFATAYLAASGSVEVLKEILGHSKIEDTMIYVHISRERKRKEAQKIKLFQL